MPTALQTNRGVVLVRAGIDELRRRSVIVPRLAVLERLCAEVIVRSERQLFEILTAGLSEGQRFELDALLKLRGSSKVSTFTWLRSPAGAPTAQNILLHIEPATTHSQSRTALRTRPAHPSKPSLTARSRGRGDDLSAPCPLRRSPPIRNSGCGSARSKLHAYRRNPRSS